MIRIVKQATPLFFLAATVFAGPLKVGEPAPEFSLTSSKGSLSSLKDHAGKSNVVLVFYRGYW
jgi:peroxiredoxin